MIQESKEKIKVSVKNISIKYLEIYRYLETCKFVFITSKNHTIKTAATNGNKTIYFHIDFIQKLTQSELTFVLMHETYHCILRHLARKGTKDPYVWNIACDYYINDKLVKDNLGTMPKDGLYDKKYEKLVPDEIYDLIYAKDFKLLQSFDNHEMQEQPDDEEGEYLEGEPLEDYSMKDLVSDLDRKGGNGSSVAKSIKDIIASEEIKNINWKSILKGEIKTYSKFSFSYSNISKKSKEILFPKMKMDSDLCNLTIAIDLSGSILPSEIKLFITEVINIIQEKKIETMQIACFDTGILFCKKYKAKYSTIKKIETDLKQLSNCGEGTDFMPIFKDIPLQKQDYLIFFTDGYPGGSWGIDRKNLYYVLTHRHRVAPIGKTLYFTKP